MEISETHRELLSAIARPAAQLSDAQFTACERAVKRAARHWDFLAPAAALDRELAGFDIARSLEMQRACIAKALLKLPETLASMHLPSSVMQLYPRAYDMVVGSLCEAREAYDADFYAKDVRLAFGHTVPAGAQFVDLWSRLGPKVIGRQIGRRDGLATAFRYVGAFGIGPWLQIHTDTRDIADFNETGWDECYKRVGDLLKRDRSIRGMIGNSWFYDPVLPGISPRLAYLHKPFDHGAFRVWTGSTSLDSERAAAKSPTRKALIDAGTYRPASYTLAWPRRRLLDWVRRQTS